MTPRAERCVLALEAALGGSKVDATRERREALSRDESETDVVLASAVVMARDEEDIANALRICSQHSMAVVPRGAGTGRTGGAAVVVDSIVLDTTAMNTVKGVERDDGLVIVEPGLVTGELHAMLEREGLFFPPDPQSAEWCTLGGNVAENAGGPRAHRYGVTRDYVRGMRAVTMDGGAFAVGRRTAKGVTGYDLTSLLVGSEGTLAVFSELWLRVIARPQHVESVLATFESMIDAGAAVLALAKSGVVARCVELLDSHCCAVIKEDAPSALPPNASVVLLIEIDGTERECEAQLERAGNALAEARATEVLVARHSGDRERLWSSRKVLSRALRARAKWKLSEDIVVPRSKVAAMLDDVRAISERESIAMPTYGHAGDGNLHVNLLWSDASERPRVDRAICSLFERTVAHGGTLSGEHGIGALKRDFLSLEQSPPLIEAQRSIKRALDPHNLLNPHKVLPAPGHRAC
jgi:glycolate oxidase